MAKRILPIFVILVLLLGAAIAVMWQKITVLEKKAGSSTEIASQATPEPKQPLAVDALKSYAKDIQLNTANFNDCLDRGKFADQVKKDIAEGEALGVRGTPAFFINGRFLGGAFPFAPFKEVIDRELTGTASANYKTYSDSLQKYYNNPSGRLFDPAPKKVDVGSAPVLGSADAGVTIVEFADFECSYCAMFHAQAYKEIKSAYIDTGKVKFAFKQFPLGLHAYAQKAAEAALCAGDQGKYWEYSDKLFEASGASQ